MMVYFISECIEKGHLSSEEKYVFSKSKIQFKVFRTNMRRASKNWYLFLEVNICGIYLSPSVSKSILLACYFRPKH